MSIINLLLNCIILSCEVFLRYLFMFLIAGVNFFIFLANKITEPWHFAKCFTAWETYHTFGFYRFQFERGGAKHAARWFYQKEMIKFFYEMAVRRNQWLRFQVWFLPWTIPYPMMMDTLETVITGRESIRKK